MSHKSCMVLFCKNKGRSISGVSYFKLTPQRYDSWLRALGRDPSENVSTYSTVCSEHFEPDDMDISATGKCNLRKGAIPKLNLGFHVVPETIATPTSADVVPSSSDIPSTSTGITHEEGPSTSHYRMEFVMEEDMELGKEIVISDAQVSKDSSSASNGGKSTSGTDTASEQGEGDPIMSLLMFFAACALFLLIMKLARNLTYPPAPLKKSRKRLHEETTSSPSSKDSTGLFGTPKRIRRDIRKHHNYYVSPRKLYHRCKQEQSKTRIVRRKLYKREEKVQQLKKKVNHLKEIVSTLRKKDFLSSGALEVLEKSFSGIPLIVMRRLLMNIEATKRGKKQVRTQFPPELRSFAMTLQFYSSKAYNYVRKVFNMALPAPSVIRSWLSSVNCKPGFSECSFNTLKTIVQNNDTENKHTLCSLVIDEMAIKKQVDYVANEVWGYEDFGGGIVNDSLNCATEVFVLMVVSLNSHWKLPIAYFLISSLTGAEKANIVGQALRKLKEVGVTISSITCDGPSANFTMATKLGAKVSDIKNLMPYFKHPCQDQLVYIIFDICHMLKLVRNNWASCKIFFDGFGRKINFELIEKLYDLQEHELFRFGTKLRKAHLDWTKQKMKVNLAAQTISASVADALEMLRTDFKHPDFQDAEGTIVFLRTFDRLFDILNSRNPYGRGSKSALKVTNEDEWMEFLHESLNYIADLKTGDNVTPIWRSRNKTPFIGFSISIVSVIGIYHQFVKHSSILNYLLTYKLSQDHLELFFLAVRSRNGWNNNPTAYQFYCNYRRLAMNLDIRNPGGNCAILDSTSILFVTKHQYKQVSPINSVDDLSIIKKYDLNVPEFFEIDEHQMVTFLPELSVLSENVVAYLSGFVVHMLKKKIRCVDCLLALEHVYTDSMDEQRFILINRKNRGKLVKPAKDVVEICLRTEKRLRYIYLTLEKKVPNDAKFVEIFTRKLAIDIFEENQVFSVMNDHVMDHQIYEENPKMSLIKHVIFAYTKTRMYSFAKKQTETIRGDLIRKTYAKFILFQHQ